MEPYYINSQKKILTLCNFKVRKITDIRCYPIFDPDKCRAIPF